MMVISSMISGWPSGLGPAHVCHSRRVKLTGLMDTFLEAGNKRLAGLYVSQTYLSVLIRICFLFPCLKQVTIEDQ